MFVEKFTSVNNEVLRICSPSPNYLDDLHYSHSVFYVFVCYIQTKYHFMFEANIHLQSSLYSTVVNFFFFQQILEAKEDLRKRGISFETVDKKSD